jgi:hypothetical protein
LKRSPRQYRVSSFPLLSLRPDSHPEMKLAFNIWDTL